MTVRNTQAKMTRRKGTVLLLGNYRATIAVARALYLEGYRVIAGLEGEPLGAHCSRYVHEFWDHPELQRDEARFLEALNELLAARRDITVVLPVSEEFVLFLAEHEAAIAGRALFASPLSRIVETFTDKVAALKLAVDQGIPTLPYACAGDHGSMLREAENIGFPLTVRGLGATARLSGRKALIIEDMASLKAALPQWPAGHEVLLLQRYARGRRHNIYFAADNGHIVGLAQTQVFRTNAGDGTGLAVDGVTEHPDEVLVRDTERLVAATSYTGIGLAQFIVDPETGSRCFLELNPRVSGSHCVAERSGLPLSRMAIDLTAKSSLEPSGNDAGRIVGEAGLRYAWTDGDLLAAKQALIRGDVPLIAACRWLLHSMRTAYSADFQMVLSWKDPGPALMSLLLVLPFCGRIRAVLRNWFTAGRSISPAEIARIQPSIVTPNATLLASETITGMRSVP